MPTTNVTELRDELLQVFDGLRGGSIDAKEAVEVNNTAGKIISTVKLQLAHAALCGIAPNIPFLGDAGNAAAALPGSVKAIVNGMTEAA